MTDGTMCVAPLHASSVPEVNVPIARAAATSVVVSPSGKERRRYRQVHNPTPFVLLASLFTLSGRSLDPVHAVFRR
jgi:hypothetical protein